MGPVLHPPPAPAAIVITLDTGGLVDEYFAAAKLYTASKRQIEVWGECRSACTILLEVPTLCVRPGAVFRWHQAYSKETGQLHPEVTARMLSRLPPRISQRLQGKIRENYTAQASLDYRDLVALGVPACPGSQAVAEDFYRPFQYGQPASQFWGWFK